jgi:hypothetical protein
MEAGTMKKQHKSKPAPEPASFAELLRDAKMADFAEMPKELRKQALPVVISALRYFIEEFEHRCAQDDSPDDVRRMMRFLFDSAKGQVFESGVESAFSREFSSLVRKYGAAALGEALGIALSDSVDPDIAAEALLCVGRIEDAATHDERRLFLERALKAGSPVVRDAAALGLASLDDAKALPSLREAIGIEQLEWVRAGLAQVANQLEPRT